MKMAKVDLRIFYSVRQEDESGQSIKSWIDVCLEKLKKHYDIRNLAINPRVVQGGLLPDALIGELNVNCYQSGVRVLSMESEIKKILWDEQPARETK